MSLKTPYGPKSTADDVLAGSNLDGKVVLLIGCNSGIGFETMKSLSSHGATVIGMARTIEAAQAECSKTGNQNTAIGCDLSDLGSISKAINEIRQIGRPLDVIIANAGIAAPKALTLSHGIEIQFLVNYLSHFFSHHTPIGYGSRSPRENCDWQQ